MAFFQRSPTELVIRFAAKGGDETIQIWRRGLPSLTKGLDKSDAEVAATRHYDLSLLVAGKAIPLTSQTGNLKPKNAPGIAYVLGVDHKSFISALATGDSIEVRRNEQLIAAYHIANSSILAARLQACVATS